MQAEATQSESKAKSGAQRVAKHRRRKRVADLQIVYGIAKLVNGKGLGDQKNALIALLEKSASDTSIPDDIATVLDDAIDKLKRMRSAL